MKCPQCQNTDISVLPNSEANSPVRLECQCNNEKCGANFFIPKVSIGTKDFNIYLAIARKKLIENASGADAICLEARGELIPKMLLVAGKLITIEKIAHEEGINVAFHTDSDGLIVPTERIIMGIGSNTEKND